MPQHAEIATINDSDARILRLMARISADLHVMLWLSIAIYIGQHINPKGDGMELVPLGPAAMVLIGTVVPALQLSRPPTTPRQIRWAAGLGVAGIVVNVLLFFWVIAELGQELAR
jgi:hypothetical protein